MKRATTKKKPAGKKTAKKPAAKNKKSSTLAAAIRRIRAKNAAFKRMSPEKKRVAIAKDVIEQLDAKAIRAQKGTYFESERLEKRFNKVINAKDLINNGGNYWSPPDATAIKRAEQAVKQDGDTQICDLFAGGASCTVCGIGAAFVSAVRLGDDLKIKDLTDVDLYGIDDSTMRDYLQRYFEPEQVNLIECAFESDGSFAGVGAVAADYADVDAAVAFGRQYESSSKRMRAIFENIIASNGTFNPSAVKSDDQDGAQ